jgi:hypothetical protein
MQLRTWVTSLAMAGALMVATAQAAMLPVNGGWQVDEVSGLNVASDNSPWTFTLSGPGVLSVVDAFNTGDIYQVFSTSGLELTTDFVLLPALWTPGQDTPDFAWVNSNFSRGQLSLGAGTYTYDIMASALPGGAPAGFYLRVDTIGEVVPEPATLALFGLGLLGLAAARRRM